MRELRLGLGDQEARDAMYADAGRGVEGAAESTASIRRGVNRWDSPPISSATEPRRHAECETAGQLRRAPPTFVIGPFERSLQALAGAPQGIAAAALVRRRVQPGGE